MTFLTEHGLLSLLLLLILSLIILLVIYIVRPNYQQKFVSSTYVWQLSLRYRRKKVPVSRIRNILIIICQILILCGCAFIIARPAISLLEDVSETEVVIVLDASASMRAENADGSRFERAVNEAKEYGGEVLEEGGIVSVVVAADENTMYIERLSGDEEAATDILDYYLDAILDVGCTYGAVDMASAVEFCQETIIQINPDATIMIFTDETYDPDSLPEGIEVTNVADAVNEWNAAILDAYTEKIDGYYMICVEIVSYGRNEAVDVEIRLSNYKNRSTGSDAVGEEMVIRPDTVYCEEGEVYTVMIMNTETYFSVYSDLVDTDSGYYIVVYDYDYSFFYYEEIQVSLVDVDDSYDLDNNYFVYGGTTQTIRVLSASTEDTVFTTAVLSAIQSAYSDAYDIIVVYAVVTSDTIDNDEYTQGFDLYIYEHIAPTYLPTDGAVFLFDPDAAPLDAGFTMLGGSDGYEDVNSVYSVYLSVTEEGESNSLMKYMSSGEIFITKASLITDMDGSYTTLMEFDYGVGTYPALIMRDDGASKVIVMPFSVHYSNFALLVDFPIFFSNMFSYFYPTTISGADYTVGEYVTVTTTGSSFSVWYKDLDGYEIEYINAYATDVDGVDYAFSYYTDGAEVIISMPYAYFAAEPGRYLIQSVSYYDNEYGGLRTSDFWIYVHADSSESDIFSKGSTLTGIAGEKSRDELFDELMFYFAIGIVALAFIEWLLHMLEGM